MENHSNISLSNSSSIGSNIFLFLFSLLFFLIKSMIPAELWPQFMVYVF